MMLTSSFNFFLSILSIFACTSYCISSSRSSFSFSLFMRLLLGLRFSSWDLLMRGRLGCFLVEFDRAPFDSFLSFAGSRLAYLTSLTSFTSLIYFTSSFFFALTAELLGRGGAFLSGTVLLF
jgi:hypothetical protein